MEILALLEVLVAITASVEQVMNHSLLPVKIVPSLTCVIVTDTAEEEQTPNPVSTMPLINVPLPVVQDTSLLATHKLKAPLFLPVLLHSLDVQTLMSVIFLDLMDIEMVLTLASIQLIPEPLSVNQVIMPSHQPLTESPWSEEPHSVDVPQLMNVLSMEPVVNLKMYEAVPMESTVEPSCVTMDMPLLEQSLLHPLPWLEELHSLVVSKLICVLFMVSVESLKTQLDVFLDLTNVPFTVLKDTTQSDTLKPLMKVMI